MGENKLMNTLKYIYKYYYPKKEKIQNNNNKSNNSCKYKENKKIKIRYMVSFYRKKTKNHYRKPKYTRISTSLRSKFNELSLIKHPLTSDSAWKKIEKHRTLVFIVNNNATKVQIKHALLKLYNFQTTKINTMLQADGRKKAYVKLSPSEHAVEIAKKILVKGKCCKSSQKKSIK